LGAQSKWPLHFFYTSTVIPELKIQPPAPQYRRIKKSYIPGDEIKPLNKITHTYSSDNSTRCKGCKTIEILISHDSHDKKEDTHKPEMRELKIY
jgi:hypothetical protein